MSYKGEFDSMVREILDGLADLYPVGWTLGSTDMLPPLPPPPLDQALLTIIKHPCIALVLGHRGSGKSSLSCRLQECWQPAKVGHFC